MSRGRKPKKRNKSPGRPGPVGLVATPSPCDCPACAGLAIDLSEVVDGMLVDDAGLALPTDPLAAEYAAAMLVAMCELAGEGYEDALADGFVPGFEVRADTPALIMLLAIGSICDGRVGNAATTAASRLVAAGIELPGWAAELGERVTASDCWRLADPEGTASMLVCSFRRAGSAHAVMVSVDYTDCGAAANIELIDADGMPQSLELVRHAGIAVDEERLDPAELRWQVESALDARAVHDGGPAELPFDEDDLPDYYPLVVLLRARMRALPDSGKPKPAHAGQLIAPRSLPRRLGAR